MDPVVKEHAIVEAIQIAIRIAHGENVGALNLLTVADSGRDWLLVNESGVVPHESFMIRVERVKKT